jgi:hypothetical protein
VNKKFPHEALFVLKGFASIFADESERDHESCLIIGLENAKPRWVVKLWRILVCTLEI